MEPNHRSIVPTLPGVPWWAAVLIAVGASAVGYLFDAGHKDLTHVFAGFYIAGCVAAVLAVRQAGVFTAVIQPPLILFCTVPGAYWLFHDGKVDKLKDLLINCGYPLIERFPLMLGTAGGVLLIGLIRWFLGKGGRTAAADEAETAKSDAAERVPLLSGIVTKLSALLSGGSSGDAADADPSGTPPAHTKRRPARSDRAARGTGRTEQRSARARSRHTRPDEGYEPGERPRRSARRSQQADEDYPGFDPSDPPRRPRRPRPPADSERTPPPRESHRDRNRDRTSRRNPYERPYDRDRPEPRGSRFDPYEGYERPESPGRGERYGRRGASYEGYDSPEPYDRQPRRSGSNGANTNSSHHPISQVRYRGQGPRDERREQYRDEPRSDRSRPRRPQTQPWEWDG